MLEVRRPFVWGFYRFIGRERKLIDGNNIFFHGMLDPITFAPTFTKPTNRMIRKFAMLATTAAIFASCGSNVEENATSTMDAAKDNATEMMDKAAQDAKDAAATMDSTVSATTDSMKQSMDNATDAAKDAVNNATDAAKEAAEKVAH
jgi:colicin import membrane protein